MSTFLHNIYNPNPRLFLSYSSPTYLKTSLKTHNSTNSKTLSISIKACYRIPARDRVIDFGKYKGKMLGTLPSTYLKWVSTNLRARDFEDWAILADQVLEDPVYQDRAEWEFAQKILNGDVLSTPSSSSAVSSLLEISERFGWDNDDKLGWRKLNFELLGTSKGGRIPRIRDKVVNLNKRDEEGGSEDDDDDVVDAGERRGERRERRERLKSKRNSKLSSQRLNLRLRGGLQRDEMNNLGKDFDVQRSKTMEVSNRFPGREGLLRKVMDAKGKRSTL